MCDLGSLRRQLLDLRDDEARRRAEERSARSREMQDLEARREQFERVVGHWLSDLVLPRLRVLAEVLPHPGKVTPTRAALHARVEFGWCEQFPVSASLTVSFAPEASNEHARVRVEPLLIPMLEGHPPAGTAEFPLQPADPGSLAQFLDHELLVFAKSYLHVRDPDSPYLRHRFVTDPVCGMAIHPSDAAEVCEHEGTRYYFCAPTCAEHFRRNPAFYLETPRLYLNVTG